MSISELQHEGLDRSRLLHQQWQCHVHHDGANRQPSPRSLAVESPSSSYGGTSELEPDSEALLVFHASLNQSAEWRNSDSLCRGTMRWARLDYATQVQRWPVFIMRTPITNRHCEPPLILHVDFLKYWVLTLRTRRVRVEEPLVACPAVEDAVLQFPPTRFFGLY